MKILILLIISISIFTITNGFSKDLYTKDEKTVVFEKLGVKKCENYSEEDIPTIFIPGILASWYSVEGYEESKVKRRIPDPITHSYDTLFNTFYQQGYDIKDVFYKDEFNLYINGNPKNSLYLFGYDWKKDNKITASLLAQLIGKILDSYEKENGCNIGKVNIVAHSMGGLVGRALLEDMCAETYYENNQMKIEGYNLETKNGKLTNYKTSACIDPITKEALFDYYKINKFITISTPQRGSPSSLVMWEKGDLEGKESLKASLGLKSQLSVKSVYNLPDYAPDRSLYLRIHGYDENIPNGIVTIGQLLPDIKNENPYNQRLKYLYKPEYFGDLSAIQDGIKKHWYIDNENYPVNSFLEELNRQDNIEKMWQKIDDKYTMYYSSVTGNKDKNNIYMYELKEDRYIYNEFGKMENIPLDFTEDYYGKDIYDTYLEDIDIVTFNIEKNIRNEFFYGGDGTVPTLNLLLVPNDSLYEYQVQNPIFESIDIKCYEGGLGKDLETQEENPLYKNIGSLDSDVFLYMCSHTKMPIATVIKVFEEISGDNSFLALKEDERILKERELLLSYLGYANYYNYSYKNGLYDGNSNLSFYGSTDKFNYLYVEDSGNGIKNNQSLKSFFFNHSLFNNHKYNNSLERKDIARYLDEFDDDPKISVDFGDPVDGLTRYEVLSPINIIIEDEKGRKIGIDRQTGKIINQIPGAWTSGDTEGTGEPEFFIIPKTGTGEINHKIKTYSTGEGDYHIVVSEESSEEITEENSDIESGKYLVIKGEAKNGFGEDYSVNIEKDDKIYKKIETKTVLDMQEGEYTLKDEKSIKIRYTIRGNSENVGKIYYELFDEKDERLKDKILDINGELEISFPNYGNYKLKVYLLDNSGEKIDSKETKKTIDFKITKTKEAIKTNSKSGFMTPRVKEEIKPFRVLLDISFPE